MGNYLRLYRERKSVSQAELARRVSVTRQSLSAIESDRQEPSLSLAMRIAAELDVPVEKIFSGESMMQSSKKSALTKLERRMLCNQYQILCDLNKDDTYRSKYYMRLVEIFQSGYIDLYDEAFENLSEELPTEISQEVLSILEMHRALRYALGRNPDPADLERIKFLGFDGNYETAHLLFAKFFCDGGERYGELMIVNSHHSTLNRYRRMLKEWERYGRSLRLTKHQVDEIVEAGER